jgi:tetrapyrrole methylase family protein / MazG family protein
LKPSPKVTVIGLGPGEPSYCSAKNLSLIDEHEFRYVRTIRHPSSFLLGPDVISFDYIYESSKSFEEVYGGIVEELIVAAKKNRKILYAVPGSPFLAERTVQLLTEQTEVEVEIFPCLSFVDLAWSSLEIDPMEVGVRIVDAHRFMTEAAGDRGPLLVTQIDSNDILADIVASVDSPPTQPVTILQRLGLEDETVQELNWEDLIENVEPDHLTSCFIPHLESPIASELQKFVDLVAVLRLQCPWDSEQTHSSLTSHLLEETYEVLEAIENFNETTGEGSEDLEEELGDLLFQIVFHSRIAAEDARFDLADVAKGIDEKLRRRHPKIFKSEEDSLVGDTPESAHKRWEELKKEEKKRSSILDGVPDALPALAYTQKVFEKSKTLGLLDEETSIERVVPETDEELGNIFLDLVFWAAENGFEAERALRVANSKFATFIKNIETVAASRGVDLFSADTRTKELLKTEIRNRDLKDR